VLVVEPAAPLQALLLAALAPVAPPLQLLTAAQALGWLSASPAQLLILDVDPVDPDRVTAGQALIAAARQQGTPVLVLTEWDSDLLQ
jgi:DNA-binding response OmpR family regulator